MKKILAVLLAAAMCLAMIPMLALAAEENYYVAGDPQFCPGGWDPGHQDNKMTKNGSVFEKTFTNVPADTPLKFKVTNGAWSTNDVKNDWPVKDVEFKVTQESSVKITFDPATKVIDVIGDHVEVIANLTKWDQASIYAVGNGSGKWLNGASWDLTAASNIMTANGRVYEITFNDVPKNNDCQFKFTIGSSWSLNFGGNFDGFGKATNAILCPDGNITFPITCEKADVTVKLDMTNFDHSTGLGATFTISLTNVTGEVGEPEPEQMVTVHAKVPEDWTKPNAYAWNSANNENNTWPGVEMTKGTDGWWTAQIPAWADRLIIDDNINNNTVQTEDLTIEPGKDVYVELAATPTEGGKYQATVTTQAPTTENDPADPVDPTDEPSDPTDAPTTPTDAPTTPTDATKPAEMVTVLAKVPEDWKNPCAYAWNSGNNQNNKGWPGVAMTAGKDGWWSIQIPAWADRLIINANDGTYQTADLTITEPGKDIKVEVTVVDGIAQAAITYSAPATGDHTMLVEVTALLVLAAVGIGALVIGKKRELF